MAQTAFIYANDGAPSALTPITGGVELSASTPFVVATSAAKVNGISYDFSVPGLYRFKNDNQNYYIYKIVVQTGASLDMYALMHAISSHHWIGTTHNTTGYGISNPMRYTPINAQCGYIAGFMSWILPQIAWSLSNVRSINVMTLGPQNGADDGHIVCETRHGTDWRMWDLTTGYYFTDPTTGKHLSTSEFIAAIANNGTFPNKNRLGAPKKVSNDSAISGSVYLNLHTYITENVAGNDTMLENWYRRIFGYIV